MSDVYYNGVRLCSIDRKYTPGLDGMEEIMDSAVYIAGKLFEVLSRVPNFPNDSDGTSVKGLWIPHVLGLLLQAHEAPEVVGEQAIRYYITAYGMNQILEIFGVDMDGLRTELDNWKKENGVS